MQLFSTKNPTLKTKKNNAVNLDVQKFNFKSIFAKGWGNRISNLLIASAFTDVKFISKVISELQKRKYADGESHLAIYLDENASHYFSNAKIKASLDSCSKKIKKYFDKDSGIFLVKCGVLFHSKFFISESNTKCRIVLGSANFTKKAFEKNEEIAIAFDAATEGNAKVNKLIKALKKYVESLDIWKIGTPREETEKSISIRNLFLKGRLYRDAKEQDPLRISLNLPDEYLELLEARKKQNAKQNATDDIFDYLETKTLNSLPLATIILRAKLELPDFFSNGKKKRSLWKNYCIDSCFGHWTPEEYIGEIEESLNSISDNKEKKIKDLLGFVEEHNDALRKSFVDFIKKIQSDRRNIDSGTWAWDSLNKDEEIEEKWNVWWEKVSAKLRDEKYEEFRKRLCRGVTYSCVPDLWDDPVSTEEFEHSVCESIRYYLSLKDRTSKKICNKIKELLEEDCDELTDDILEEMSDDDLLNNYLCNCDFSDSEDEE
jgi:hypothetical protein